MTTTETTVDTTVDDQRRDALVERLFGSLLGGMELLSIDLGRRLGLYAMLSESGPETAAGFARRARIAERYAREWLEQQAVAGILGVDAPDRPSVERRYTLPAAHADVLVHAEHPANLMGAAPSLTGLALTLSAVAEAYRTGTGVSYADFGADIRHGISAFNRPMFVGELADTWLAALPEVRDRLAQGGCVLDVGCGTGWSSIALARAFPQTTIVGIDLDQASIADARDNAQRAGVADRVTFEVCNAAAYHPAGAEHHDLACVFEALHDMGEPVAALRCIRAALAPGAPVLIADERVAERFTAPADEVERFMYGWSVLHCLPATIDESDAIANGTVLRESTVRDWARQAGFHHVQTLPIDNDFWRFYRLDA